VKANPLVIVIHTIKTRKLATRRRTELKDTTNTFIRGLDENGKKLIRTQKREIKCPFDSNGQKNPYIQSNDQKLGKRYYV
jgi:hypothetical protein